MPYDDDDDQSNESGGELRKKLELALKGNVALTDQLAGYLARDLITEKSLTLVKPDDLKGVELKELESKATALQAERLAQQESLLRNAFERQGYEGAALEQQLALATGHAGAENPAANLTQARDLGRLPGTVVPINDPRELSPLAKIEAGILAAKRKKA